MIAGSLFTGIGGFDLGFEHAGIMTAWQAEQDKNCLALLEDKFPNAKRYNDVKEITGGTADVVTGGFPCQDVSLAGKRAGLDGERSGLWFEFHRIIAELRPRWVVIENVPGLLSSNEGRDMGTILGGLAECGYGWAYRVLDAQFFGVAQRRRRVFIVGSLGNASAAKVLFERKSGPWNTPPSRETGKGTANTIERSVGVDSEQNALDEQIGTLRSHQSGGNEAFTFAIRSGKEGEGKGYLGLKSSAMTLGGQTQWLEHVAFQQNTRDEVRLMNGDGQIAGALASQPGMKQQNYLAQRTVGALQACDGKGIGTTVDDKLIADVAPTLEAEYFTKRYSNQQFFSQNGDGFPVTVWHNRQQDGTIRVQDETMPTVSRHRGTGGNNVPFIGVRRLTPTECERLQGFPDGWTEGFSDSARYRMLGNAVAVPVAEWIARRIVEVDNEC